MFDVLNEFLLPNPLLIKVQGLEAILYFFMVYSFLGWLLENSFSFLTKKVFFKEGFFWGPFKPMYGFAPLILLSLITPKTHWALFILLCFIIPTMVEYMSGFFLDKFFHRQWWDYSNSALQIHGHICLSFSLCWLVLSIICLKYIHPAIVSSYAVAKDYWSWFYPVVALYFLGETLLAVRRHSAEKLVDRESANPVQ